MLVIILIKNQSAGKISVCPWKRANMRTRKPFNRTQSISLINKETKSDIFFNIIIRWKQLLTDNYYHTVFLHT